MQKKTFNFKLRRGLNY